MGYFPRTFSMPCPCRGGERSRTLQRQTTVQQEAEFRIELEHLFSQVSIYLWLAGYLCLYIHLSMCLSGYLSAWLTCWQCVCVCGWLAGYYPWLFIYLSVGLSSLSVRLLCDVCNVLPCYVIQTMRGSRKFCQRGSKNST